MNDFSALSGLGGVIVGGAITWVVTMKNTRRLQDGENERLRILLRSENERTSAQFQHEINQKEADRLRILFAPFFDLHMMLRALIRDVLKSVDEKNLNLKIDKTRGALIMTKAVAVSQNFGAIELDPACKEINASVRSAIEYAGEIMKHVVNPEFDPLTDDGEFSRLKTEYDATSRGAIDAIHGELIRLGTAVTVNAPSAVA